MKSEVRGFEIGPWVYTVEQHTQHVMPLMYVLCVVAANYVVTWTTISVRPRLVRSGIGTGYYADVIIL